jgi:CMP-N-acetylneuraminic acid synthetase
VKIVAIVPARGGSKSIPLKTLQPLAGKPLIVYTIEAARKFRGVERLVVSTDREDIAQVERASGARVVVRPPAEAPAEFALLHLLDTLKATESYEGRWLLE